MKKEALFLFFFAIISSPFCLAQKWVKYENKTARFSTEFPQEPKEEIEDDETGKAYTATLSVDGYIFMSSALIHKTNLSVEGLTQEAMAQTSLDAFEKALGATKVTKKNYYIRSNTGLDAEIEVPGFDNPILYRIIVIDQIQYQVVVMKKEGKAKIGKMKKFIGSFRIVK